MYNKYFIFLSLFLVFTLSANDLSAQPKKKKNSKDPLADLQLYIFKADWSAAANWDECIYFMQMNKESDSLFVCKYYNKVGPMVRQESYKDSDLTIPEGRFCWYNSKGYLDSTGIVSNGRKDKFWEYLQNGISTQMIRYDKGKLLTTTDNAAKTFTDENGNTIPLEEKRIADSVAMVGIVSTQIEAKYKDGSQGWVNYLQKNLDTPDRLVSVLGEGRFTVIASFLINKLGDVDDTYLIKSVEWSGDERILKTLKNSPKWEPAMQENKPVIYRQKQSLTFTVSR